MDDVQHNDWNAMNDDYIAGQIGEFVKYHRIRQNSTQAMVAKDAGISRSTLSLLERGGIVTVSTLVQVLRVLDQLQVFDKFTIIHLQSPLMLAKAEKKRKHRATTSRKKGTDISKETDW